MRLTSAPRTIIIVLIILVAAICANAQSGDVRLDTLSLPKAIELALAYHPSVRSANATVRIASSGVTQSVAGYLPTISSTMSGTKTSGAFVLNPSIPARIQEYNNYSVAIQGQETIYDFGKTSNRVSASYDSLEAANSDYQVTKGNVILNVELAYFGYVQAEKVIGVDEEAVSHADQHLKQAQAFYKVGTRTQLDVTKAEVDLANANVGLISAKNQLQLAKLQLENSMGMHPQGDYEVQDVLDVQPFPMPLDTAMKTAFEQLPEYHAATARLSQTKALVSAAWDQDLPTLLATANYTWTNFYFPLLSRWTAGVTLNIPIFQGFAIDAQVSQAQASADASQANLETLRESIRLNVEQNYYDMKEALDRIDATDHLVESAEQSLTLAEKQYAAGVGSAIDVSDAQLELSNARITRIQALYDYNSSLTKLKRAIGMF